MRRRFERLGVYVSVPFDCQWLRGKPQRLGCVDLRWVTLDELDAFAFPVADQRIISFLRNQETKSYA